MRVRCLLSPSLSIAHDASKPAVYAPAGSPTAHERNGVLKRVTLSLAASVSWLALIASPATAKPMPTNWHAPPWWLAQAVCIHGHEGAWNSETGNGYSGGMQFLQSTWYSVGGTGRASQWSPREQLYRAWLVWRRDGGSWREWGTAGMCGLR